MSSIVVKLAEDAALQRFASYGEVAGEYYDADRHPTCAAFRELSYSFIAPRARTVLRLPGRLVEIGAGRSILAELVDPQTLPHVTLLDASLEMLSHSSQWSELGASLVVAPADRTGLTANSCSLVVASLGDPYNTSSLWNEVGRILSPEGVCLFTTPSAEWVQKFRSFDQRAGAEFLLRDGCTVTLPSFVPSAAAQDAMFRAAGLHVIESEGFGLSELKERNAPKLLIAGGEPVLRGYALRRA